MGFNQRRPPDRSLALALDFSRAFDTVPHSKLLSALNQSTIDHNTVRWLNSYLRGRFCVARYNGAVSASSSFRAGVPQGSVLSPLLFNFFVATFPQTADLTCSYADDFTSVITGNNLQDITNRMTTHTSEVESWAAGRCLQVSATKSTLTLFTPDKAREGSLHPVVSVDNNRLPLDKTPKILGVVFDTHFNFGKQVEYVAERAASRLRILKALSGTGWGQQRETLLVTYKALVRSLMTYAAPVWYPNASNVRRLQTIQNSALRVVTGCHAAASAEHVHMECKMLPVAESLAMACSQFLAGALVPSHPSHGIVTLESGPRPMKNTLQSVFLPSIAHLLHHGSTPPGELGHVLSAIHSETVLRHLETVGPNRVLNEPAPEVSEAELGLPRAYRSVLSQLRSGFCRHLNDFSHRIGLSVISACPSCGAGPHTVRHLFSCPAHPTTLTTRSLWTEPVGVASYLAGLPFFGHLRPLERPPPEPPPTTS